LNKSVWREAAGAGLSSDAGVQHNNQKRAALKQLSVFHNRYEDTYQLLKGITGEKDLKEIPQYFEVKGVESVGKILIFAVDILLNGHSFLLNRSQ